MGTLDGVTQRLDYLNDGTDQSLGVDAIWLTPIFDSQSYHGYDAKSFLDIKPEYGDLNSFKRLLEESHKRGIRVYLDLAINHTSHLNPWFQTQNAFYLWSPKPLHWGKMELKPGEKPEDHWHPLNGNFFFSTFGRGTMPDLNWRNADVLKEVKQIFLHWTQMGVDGFRLDAAKFLVKGPEGETNTHETHAIWQEIASSARAVNPGIFLIGEVWDSSKTIARYYGGGKELNACFDFPVSGGLRYALQNWNAEPFSYALKDHVTHMPTVDFTSPFLGNHDMPRAATYIGNDVKRLKLGALATLTLPGPTSIYYGEEIGLPDGVAGTHVGDLRHRTPMQWDSSETKGFTSKGVKPWLDFSANDAAMTVSTQNNSPDSLLQTYRQLIHLRNKIPELRQGQLALTDQKTTGVVSYFRTSKEKEGSCVLVVMNFSKTSVDNFSVPLDANCPKTFSSEQVFGRSKGVPTNRNARPSMDISNLGSAEGAVFRLTPQ